MKIQNRKVGLFPALLALIYLFLSLSGCVEGARTESQDPERYKIADTAEITEDSHDRESDYTAAFRTHALNFETLSVQMEDRIFDEAALRGYAKDILCELEMAGIYAGTEPQTVTLYIVGETLGGLPEAVGAQVFCSLSDMENRGYRPALLGAAFGLSSEWQRAGFAEYVFEEEDGIRLAEYYNEGGHDLTASCSAAHLSPLISDENTVRAARATARSLARFIIKNNGFAAFRKAKDTAPYLPAWAESVGLTVLPALPEKSAAAADLKIGKAKTFDCVLKVQNFSVYVTVGSWTVDPDELYSFICDYFAGIDLVLDRIRREAPKAAAIAEERFTEQIRITTLDPMTNSSCAYPYRNEIFLARKDAVWHETMHLLFEEPQSSDRFGWLNEGIAEHFTYPAATVYAPVDYISGGFDAYLDFFEEVSSKEADANDMVFHRSVMNLYQKFRSPEAKDYDDQGAYFRAYGISSLLLFGKIERSQERVMYDKSVAYKRGMSAGKKEADGNALSYPEAAVMYEYLAAVYGADNVIDAYLNGVLPEKAFGASYSELFDAAIAYYTGLYGEYIALD